MEDATNIRESWKQLFLEMDGTCSVVDALLENDCVCIGKSHTENYSFR